MNEPFAIKALARVHRFGVKNSRACQGEDGESVLQEGGQGWPSDTGHPFPCLGAVFVLRDFTAGFLVLQCLLSHLFKFKRLLVLLVSQGKLSLAVVIKL